MNKWDKRFMDLAAHVATWSKDPSTQVGAVVVNDDKQVIGLGYNGFPRRVFDGDSRYATKEVKYLFVSHAERNALDNTFVATKGATLYSTLYPCNECAKGIIQKGIRRVVTRKPDRSKTYLNYNVTTTMFIESNVEVEYLEDENDNSGREHSNQCTFNHTRKST